MNKFIWIKWYKIKLYNIRYDVEVLRFISIFDVILYKDYYRGWIIVNVVVKFIIN